LRRVRLEGIRSAATAILFVVLVAVLSWLYAPTAAGLGNEWLSSPDSSYGGILAVIAFLTAWKRRSGIVAAAKTPGHFGAGAAALCCALGVYLVGLFAADVFVTRVSLVVVLAGVVCLLTGAAGARLYAAPLVFLLIAIPLPALVVNAITLPLQLVASRMAELMLTAATIPVFRDGNVLELRSTSLQVAEACSGLRSLISLAAVGSLAAWAMERSFLRRTLVIASALPIALVFNAVRIAATGIACETWGPSAARGGWHAFSGWLTFVCGMLALWQVQRALQRSSTGLHVPQTVSA
jgi:exosortase